MSEPLRLRAMGLYLEAARKLRWWTCGRGETQAYEGTYSRSIEGSWMEVPGDTHYVFVCQGKNCLIKDLRSSKELVFRMLRKSLGM
jgi:hypothetical protein